MSERRQNYGFAFIIFVFCFIFFTKAYPLIPFDGDDWQNLAGLRPIALPKWAFWNPIKVLPETLYPLTGYVSAYLIAPLMTDGGIDGYLSAISTGCALVLSAFITIYVYLVHTLLQKRFHLPAYQTITLSLFFFSLHFLIFRSHSLENAFLFQSVNLTCCFHYTIPALLNASMLLYFLLHDIGSTYKTGDSIGRNALLWAGVYFCLFSNIMSSILLISFVLIEMLPTMHELTLRKAALKAYFHAHSFFLTILVLWVLSLLFELSGGRASDVGQGLTWEIFEAIFASIASFVKDSFKGLLILAVAILLFVLPAVRMFRKSSVDSAHLLYGRILRHTVLGFVLVFFFLLAVSAKVHSPYIIRPDVSISLFFLLFLLCVSSMAYLLSKKQTLYYAILLLSFCAVCRAFVGSEALAPSTFSRLPPAICQKVDKALIEEIIENDEKDAKTLALHVPVGNDIDNWPHNRQFAYFMARTLYNHSMIHNRLENCRIVPDASLNEIYRLPLRR